MMGMITLLMLWLTGSMPQSPQLHNLTPQHPQYTFRSTSNMLPSTPTYAREYAAPFSSSGPARAIMALGDDDDDVGEHPGYRPGMPGAPIGDVPWGLMLILAAGYIVVIRSRRRVNLNQDPADANHG